MWKKIIMKWNEMLYFFYCYSVYLFFQQDRIRRDDMWLHGDTNGDNIDMTYWFKEAVYLICQFSSYVQLSSDSIDNLINWNIDYF